MVCAFMPVPDLSEVLADGAVVDPEDVGSARVVHMLELGTRQMLDDLCTRVITPCSH
jgi:hypothetical protein